MSNIAPPPNNTQTVDSRQFRDWFYSVFQYIQTSGGNLGTIAKQNANNVDITGGTIGGVSLTGDTIDNTQIGSITPNTIKGTVITATDHFVGSGSGLTNIPTSAITGGISVTITTAKLTPTGTNGSMTFTHGILTAQTQAT